MKKYALILLAFISINTPTYAIHLKHHHPMRYTVKKGDTLWSIAEKFLSQPWEWRQLWRKNPSIKHPNKIYPGDILELHNLNGKPRLSIAKRGVIRLSPTIRRKAGQHPIPPISLNAIKPFLNNSQVLAEEELRTAPYVVGFSGEYLVGSPGHHVYVKDLHGDYKQNYTIYRDNGKYIDPNTKEVLGHSALHVGDAQVVKQGDPATVVISSVQKRIEIGDRLLQLPGNHYDTYYLPGVPSRYIEGQIISLFGGITTVGAHHVVVINRGIHDGLANGDVLAIEQPGRLIQDPLKPKQRVLLPSEHTGDLLVFRTFDRVSFGLVMKATKAIRLHDCVVNP